MSVQLLAIKFNHDSSSATTDALNLRRNATQFITVPEWQRGVSVNSDDSPAAYALAKVRGNTVTIQARFRSTTPELTAVEVRALDADVDPPGPGGCAGLIVRIFRALVRALVGNVLGEVAPRSIIFSAGGDSGFQTFQLQHTKLDSSFVSARITRWRWQYRTAGGSWTDIETTAHRIYLVLDVPTGPWQQQPYAASNVQLPWTEVLDYACNWAVTSTDPDAAATRITRRVYELGPGTLEYDCPGGGSTRYALGAFNCTAFIERLRGGVGNGKYVNCTDCATFVSTFSNVLGCHLWQSRMYPNSTVSFGLNPIRAIGAAAWYPGCPNWLSKAFSYHEVAWKGACQVNDEVFDGCLEVDGDADPTAPPHTPLLPANMRFGNPGDGDYRDRLATPAGRPHCIPQPSSRTRRIVY
jgi:hypothetical protein